MPQFTVRLRHSARGSAPALPPPPEMCVGLWVRASEAPTTSRQSCKCASCSNLISVSSPPVLEGFGHHRVRAILPGPPPPSHAPGDIWSPGWHLWVSRFPQIPRRRSPPPACSWRPCWPAACPRLASICTSPLLTSVSQSWGAAPGTPGLSLRLPRAGVAWVTPARPGPSGPWDVGRTDRGRSGCFHA